MKIIVVVINKLEFTIWIYQDLGETALHLAILREMGSSLHIVDFLAQNMPTGGIDRTSIAGETALHLSARHDRAEAMKLLLRAGADPTLRNNQDKTPLDIAQELGHHTCKELVNIDIEFRSCWSFMHLLNLGNFIDMLVFKNFLSKFFQFTKFTKISNFN